MLTVKYVFICANKTIIFIGYQKFLEILVYFDSNYSGKNMYSPKIAGPGYDSVTEDSRGMKS